MVASTRLYDLFPRFLELYEHDLEDACRDGTLLRAVRAFLQLRDRHACHRAPLLDAVSWIDSVDAHQGVPFATVRALLSKTLRAASPWDRFVPVQCPTDLETLYTFVLQAPRDVGRAIFEGMVLLSPAQLPRHIRGTWAAETPCARCSAEEPTATATSPLLRFLHVLEANSYVPVACRYREPHRVPCVHQSAVSRDVWIVRRGYVYPRHAVERPAAM